MNYIEARTKLTEILWNDGEITPEEVVLLELLANILGGRVQQESDIRSFLKKYLQLFQSASYFLLPQSNAGVIDIVIADTPSRKAWRAISVELAKAVQSQNQTVSVAVVSAGNSKFQKAMSHRQNDISFIDLSMNSHISRATHKRVGLIVSNMLEKIQKQDDRLYAELIQRRQLILSYYAAEFNRMVSAARWFKLVKCKVLVVQTEHQFTSYVNAAHLAGCKVFQILHGTPSPLYWPFVSDKTWVWGKTTKKYFENLGCHPDRLEIIGNLEMELDKKQIPQGNSVDKKNLLFFSQVSGDRLFKTTVFTKSLDWVKVAIELLGQDWTLTVRMHPVDNEDDVRKVKEIFSFLEDRLIISRTNSMAEDVGNATLACTCSSTAILAPLSAKVPSFVLWSSGIDAINGSPFLPGQAVIKEIGDISAIQKYKDQDVENVISDVLANRGNVFEVAANYLISVIHKNG